MKRFWAENRGTWTVVLASDGTETFRHVWLTGEEWLMKSLDAALEADASGRWPRFDSDRSPGERRLE